MKNVKENIDAPVGTNDTPLTLKEYILVWNRNDNAYREQNDGSVLINITSMSAMNFSMMLQALFAKDWNFEVISGFEILAKPKGEMKTQSQSPIENPEPEIEPGSDYTPEFEKPFDSGFESWTTLAERIDNDFAEILIEDEGLEIKSERFETLQTIAKIVDKIDENLKIELYNKKLVIKN